MDIKLDFFLQQKDGCIAIRDSRLTQFGEKRIHVQVQRAKSRRSNSQNAYLWGVCYVYALKGFHDAGYLEMTVDDVHREFKQMFCTEYYERVNEESGEVIRFGHTTTQMTKTAMMDYIMKIQKFCAEWFGIVIPGPMPLTPVEN